MKAPNSVFLCRYKMLYREIQNKSLQLFHLVKKCLLHCATRTKKNPQKNPYITFNILALWLKKMILKKYKYHTQCHRLCSNVIKILYSQENDSRYSNELHSNVFSRVNTICHREKCCFIIFWLQQEWFIYKRILNCSGEKRKNQDHFTLCPFFKIHVADF